MNNTIATCIEAMQNEQNKKIRNDNVVVEGDLICYYYHNNMIASLNTKKNTLFISNRYYETYSTKERLNDIINAFVNGGQCRYSIYQKDFKWYIEDRKLNFKQRFTYSCKFRLNGKNPLLKNSII